MRFDYWFLRYYKYYAARRLIDLCLVAVVLIFSFYFFDKNAMIGSFTERVKTEVLKLKSVNRSYVRNGPSDLSSDAVTPFKIPKSCISSDARNCVCYDQHTTVITDFPVDRCQDIVNGLTRF
ncbi:hypothetical protein SAMN05216333_1314 [Nitrosomonas oligotropha]|uniref:Uncharacterized protein n=1 Tax=Nitrosomonas oligotropha TaxID=42354 RepID=A0A1H8U792_9PROT|nr:hypothetical protein SAMN05216300_1354 [Nitrosomonas oligotropha]SEO98528.1 hypothetical protein SAMN05216333_1314 [Nitrosomonas oligotropha]